MAKKKAAFFCKECGYESIGWLGKCPACEEWNSFVEAPSAEPVTAKAKAKTSASWLRSDPATAAELIDLSSPPAAQSAFAPEARLSTAIPEFDRVLGGGLVRGSLVLIGGDPGIGKSTLLLQVCGNLSAQASCLYVSGEESALQIRLRADRLQLKSRKLKLLLDTNVLQICTQALKLKPELIIIDSIQTLFVPDLAGAPGSVSQIREATAHLLRLAKEQNICIVLVGHITKEGSLAGPRVLEHMVDAVLYFEGDGQEDLRILRSVKNRFGATSEIGIFEMRQAGLFSVAEPATALLQGRPLHVPGSIVSATIEGSRAIMVEIQALVTASHFPQAMRMSQGIDRLRLSMLLAVLEKKLNFNLGASDCYVNIAGGLKIQETALDLPLLAAVVSSFKEQPLPPDLLVVGELGLAGEIRTVRQIEKRVQEALAQGWKNFIVPSQCEKALARLKLKEGQEIYYVSLLNEALDLLFR